MAYENILFEVKDGVGVLTFNRPKALNALNPKTLEEVESVIDATRKDENIRVLVLTGAGDKAFVAGADISEFPKMNPLQARMFAEKGQEVFFKLEQLPKPVLACVNGFALGGGCEIAMSCDFIYASDKAKFGQPEVNLGVIPGFGGTQRLARLIGRAKAKELCMTGEMIDAQQAKDLGLVAKVFPADQLMEETMKVAKLLSTRGQGVLRSIKQVVDRGMDVDLKTGCALEAEAFGVCFASQDAKEGVSAFLEKRKPQFKGSLES
ncbi:enoyl-CoA hydratase-related protein [Desulforhabdus amnigena]|jgi:enoyl-CoA hydratase|uniref:Crotonase n=1 Tax=Desulforhabdus amnigena TaxID=40218 RepID=A0A9W6FWB9_9BACT|nr:enoyl-CoA hydratase-related protein [Desulforhabdus amnigena]NLJ28275.1 enoyl-CoA hydratase/isomerase family protein [Deltaproteobacteria bacterium]GLI36139.1 crotonase [Desulforhabdus amnigena]